MTNEFDFVSSADRVKQSEKRGVGNMLLVYSKNYEMYVVMVSSLLPLLQDLVKSHLMFAVREEVEVLKEQIKDLLEKNTQLEYENSILKSAATPETLAKLQQSKPVVPTSSSTS